MQFWVPVLDALLQIVLSSDSDFEDTVVRLPVFVQKVVVTVGIDTGSSSGLCCVIAEEKQKNKTLVTSVDAGLALIAGIRFEEIQVKVRFTICTICLSSGSTVKF